jgi:adenosylhomocysteine nucleosidase
VRVILDAADEELPLDFNQLIRPDRSLDRGKLARALVRSPGQLPGLLRLQRNCGRAADALARVLAGLIGQAATRELPGRGGETGTWPARCS